RCFAVDLWRGDEHAGWYGKEVLEALRQYHEPRYASFSSLVQSSFDDAARHFPDGSIDLLHIDGRHYYDDVRHDFETWRPKLSERAVVLFHDTNVHRREFGVFRLWTELAEGRPHFEFLHGHGLGILAVGDDYPKSLDVMFGADAASTVQIREAYARLGGAISLQMQLTERTAALTARTAELAAKAAELTARMAELTAQTAEQEALRTQFKRHGSAASVHLAEAHKFRQEAQELAKRLESALRDAGDRRRELTQQAEHLKRVQQKLKVVRRSVVWRLALPLRLLEKGTRSIVRRARKSVRNGAKNRQATVAKADRPRGSHPRRSLWQALSKGSAKKAAKEKARKLGPTRDGATGVTAVVPADPAATRKRIAKLSRTRYFRQFEVTGQPISVFMRDGQRSRHASFDHDRERYFRERIDQLTLSRRPLVSIIMPTHNREATLGVAVASVLAQDYADWELLVIDDGSTDRTPEILRDFAADPRIQAIRTENRGAASARNRGLAAAQGEYIAYLDSDNSWRPDFLRMMIVYLEHSDYEAAYSGVEVHGKDGISYLCREYSYAEMCSGNYIDLNSTVHRHDLYRKAGGFDESLRRTIDWDLFLRYGQEAAFIYLPFLGVNYDHDLGRTDRISVSQALSWKYVVMNKNLIKWEEARVRQNNLVSIIVLVKNDVESVNRCIASVLQADSQEYSFEIVLVDNGSSSDASACLMLWQANFENIKVVKSGQTVNYALGCNLGFAHANGQWLVFLNADLEVRPGWLDSLIRGLQSDQTVGAAQPKLLNANSTVRAAGFGFPRDATLAVPLYANFPDDAASVSHRRQLKAVSSACIAVRAGEFSALSGFDPLYVDMQVDVDFCLRMKAEFGKCCLYEPESRVNFQVSAPIGPSSECEFDRELFVSRWHNKVQPDLEEIYKSDGYRVGQNLQDAKAGSIETLAGQPTDVVRFAGPQHGVTIGIRIGCPSARVKDEWGDYHFAAALADSLRRLGFHVEVSFLDEWRNGPIFPYDVNLVLRGLSMFPIQPSSINLMWLVSHPAEVSDGE
ncbi:MAG: glycosyltransferase, partial [Microvirga sp.]